MNNKKKILVLDDEGCIRDLLNEILQEAGYDVITAADPGMAAVRVHQADLVILDLNMLGKADRQGLNVLVHMWEDKLNNTPVILFSAYLNLQETLQAVEEVENRYGEGRKVYACIPKSDGMVTLVESIHNLFRSVKNNSNPLC